MMLQKQLKPFKRCEGEVYHSNQMVQEILLGLPETQQLRKGQVGLTAWIPRPCVKL